MAVVQEDIVDADSLMAYIINFNDFPLSNVLVSSKGYGTNGDRQIKTTTFSHYRESIAPQNAVPLEPISMEVLGINNEFFVTYYVDGLIYDKKFIFLPEVIQPGNFIEIKMLEKKGVLIR